MHSERVLSRIEDIVANADRIASYLNGINRDMFFSNPMMMDAVERCLQRITEAVIHIGEDAMRDISPSTPFRDVKAMGNILRHEYQRIDPMRLWELTQIQLASLRSDCARALGTQDKPT